MNDDNNFFKLLSWNVSFAEYSIFKKLFSNHVLWNFRIQCSSINLLEMVWVPRRARYFGCLWKRVPTHDVAIQNTPVQRNNWLCQLDAHMSKKMSVLNASITITVVQRQSTNTQTKRSTWPRGRPSVQAMQVGTVEGRAGGSGSREARPRI